MYCDENTVAICMATYNGELYIEDQVDSIINQSYDNIILFVRDDGSKDETPVLLKKLHNEHPNKIIIIDDPELKGGCSKSNFASIVSWVSHNYSFNYYMFSDQDDIWLETKVEETLKCMKENEKEEAILVHTDLKVVDADLNLLGESFFDYRALNPDIADLNHLLVQNNITGCTMMWNRKLNTVLNLMLENIAMHDWWMALVACCFGKIVCLNKPTILYRQHSNNVIGATKVNTPLFVLQRLFNTNHVKKTLQLSKNQAQAFLEYYHNSLTSEQLDIIENFLKISDYRKMKRVFKTIQGSYLKQGWVQVVGELMFV